MTDYRGVNRQMWDERAPAHAASPGYSVERFADDPAFLSYVVQFDRPRLGDLTGLRGVHLQCHIGTDTLSLARLGATTVTGYDFSPSALAVARKLAHDAGVAIDYVEGELYDAVERLGGQRFDVVYTGTGALCWLPDVKGWAKVVAALLRPAGVLHIHEGHPVLWAIDHERDDGLLSIRFPYFETATPLLLEEPGTYTDGDPDAITHNATAEWNHGIGEVVQACIEAGLTITALHELQYCDWLALPDVMEITDSDGAARLRDGPERLPLSYTLQARLG